MRAYNFITLVEYSGNNATLEGCGELNAFATFNQIKESGYSVNKGAKSVSIFTGYYSKEDKNENGQNVTIPTYARVFDIADTSAITDENFVEWLKTEAVIVESPHITDMKMAQAVFA